MADEMRMLYRTFSLCPCCVLLDRAIGTSMQWKNAAVVAQGGRVFLSVGCGKHGRQDTLYCSNESFFKRVLTFGDAPSLSGVDIEDIAAKMRYQNKVESQRPLVGSLALFDGHEFVSDQLLREQMALLSSVYPAGQEFILRAQTKLAMDMERLNERIGFVLSHLQVVSKRAASSSSSSSSSTTPPSAAIPRVPSPILLVESSCERLELLAQLPSSVFLDPLVYPALRMYVIRGEEAEAMQQLTEFIEAMRGLSGIQCVVTLVVDAPYPDLRDVLALLRKHPSLVRFIVLSQERGLAPAMGVLREEVEREEAGIESTSTEPLLSVDPYRLLQHIEQQSAGSIAVDDFVPANVLEVLEPLMTQMGYGQFCLRASPFCGFATALLNTADYESVPVSRVLDIDKLYKEMLPIARKTRGKSLGWFTARSIRKAFENCARPGATVVDVVEYMTNSRYADTARTFIRNLQFLIVHNNMDVAGMDLVRRCNCASVTPSPLAADSVSASCSGCI